MATVVYGDLTRFPDGTVLGIYEDQAVPPNLQGAPVGPAIATATVTNGSVSFSNLANDENFWIGGQVGGEWRYAGVGTQPLVPTLTDDDVAALHAADPPVNASNPVAGIADLGSTYSPPIPQSEVFHLEVDLAAKVDGSQIDTDTTLASNSDIKVPSQKAVKTYVDSHSGGAAGGDLTGSYPNPEIAAGAIVDADVSASAAIAESKLALASDAAAGTASRRTLGTGALQAAAGNDSRLTNARTPTAHATSHKSGGSDALALNELAVPVGPVNMNGQSVNNVDDPPFEFLDSAMNKGNTEALLHSDLDVQYANVPDGKPGYDEKSGYKIAATGAGAMQVSGGYLVNTVANQAGYAVSTLRRRPRKLTCTFRLVAGGGTDAAEPTVALVACKRGMDFNVYQDLAHFIWTRSSMSFQKFVGGVFTNIATYTYATPLALNTDYTVSVEINPSAVTGFTMTDPYGVEHENSDTDLDVNWRRTVFHEIVEQANSPKVRIRSFSATELLLTGKQSQVVKQGDWWLPQNPADGTPAIAENIPMGRFQSAAMTDLAVLTSGVLYLAGGMVLPNDTRICRVRFLSGTTAAGSPTNQWACLLDRQGRVVAVSADKTTEAWAADSFKTFEFFGLGYLPPGPMPVYVGLMVKATTPPSIVGVDTGPKFNWVFAYDDAIAGNAAATGLTTPVAVNSIRPINSPSGLTTKLAYVVAE